MDGGWVEEVGGGDGDGDLMLVVEGVVMYLYEKEVKRFVEDVGEGLGGGEEWLEVWGRMMRGEGVKGDWVGEEEGEMGWGVREGGVVEEWEGGVGVLEEGN